MFKQTETILPVETIVGLIPLTAMVETAPVVVSLSGIATAVVFVNAIGAEDPPVAFVVPDKVIQSPGQMVALAPASTVGKGVTVTF